MFDVTKTTLFKWEKEGKLKKNRQGLARMACILG